MLHTPKLGEFKDSYFLAHFIILQRNLSNMFKKNSSIILLIYIHFLFCSTDVYEVDAQHEEKPVIENMEKKIDVCFDKLEKPLGLSICGKWEVPRPLVSSSFPYVRGIGNIEMAIKKTDLGMSSYVLSVEVPRRKVSLI